MAHPGSLLTLVLRKFGSDATLCVQNLYSCYESEGKGPFPTGERPQSVCHEDSPEARGTYVGTGPRTCRWSRKQQGLRPIRQHEASIGSPVVGLRCGNSVPGTGERLGIARVLRWQRLPDERV